MNTVPYRLGLSMAGAVSAGAYTSGVLTQLLEALNLWYDLKDGLKPELGKSLKLIGNDGISVYEISIDDLPQHEILITSISGTSAGGMCSALLPIVFAENNLNRLRKTWVEDVDIKQMLNVSDLKGSNKNLLSILNVDGIDSIKEDAKKFIPDSEIAAGTRWYPYLNDYVDIYLNFTNLEGVPYQLNYSDDIGAKSQIIRSFADFKRFTFLRPGSNLNKVPLDSTILDPSKKTSSGSNYEWDGLLEAAITTGAFPFGLSPRTLVREKREYDNREFFLRSSIPKDGSFPIPSIIKPNWPSGSPPTFKMEYVDGGVTNNEPFEQARRSVAKEINKFRNPRNGEEAISGVILIDPFPSEPISKMPGDTVQKIPNVFSLLPMLFYAMKDNAQFDFDLLESILNPEIYSRFMIAPIRQSNASEQPNSTALASELLSAFSGFFSELFRDHDFRLAKYNTSRFLQYYFALPIGNQKIFGNLVNDTSKIELYRKIGWVFNKNKRGEIVPEGTTDSIVHMTLIPQFNFADQTYCTYYNVQPVWPQISKNDLDLIRDNAFVRFKKVRYNTIDLLTSFKFDTLGDSVIDAFVSQFLGEEKFNAFWKTNVEDKFIKADLIKY